MSSSSSLMIMSMAVPLGDPIDHFVDLGLGAHVDAPDGRLCKRVVTVAPLLLV
jgi:hypothetical protein